MCGDTRQAELTRVLEENSRLSRLLIFIRLLAPPRLMSGLWYRLCLEHQLAEPYCGTSGACEFRITAHSLRMTPIHNIFYFKPNGDVYTTSQWR